MTNKPKKPIIPIIEKCAECKIKAVKNHHFLCDKCWGKKEKRRYNKIQNKIVKEAKKAKMKKKLLEDKNDN